MKRIFKVLFLSVLVVGIMRPLHQKNDELAEALKLAADCRQAKAEDKEDQDFICEQLKMAETEINAHLRKISQLEQAQAKAFEPVRAKFQEKWTWGMPYRKHRLLKSSEFKNCMDALEKFESGIITGEEKDVICLVMLQSKVYKKCEIALNEEIKNKALWDGISLQLKNEPENLRAIIKSRNFNFENDVRSSISTANVMESIEAKIMESIDAKFPIGYTVEELDKILSLQKQYDEAYSCTLKASNSRKIVEYVVENTKKFQNNFLQVNDNFLQVDAREKYKLTCEEFDKAAQNEKELHEQLINVLKAPQARQNQ